MTQVRYMLDTNVLNNLQPSERSGEFVHEHCRVPSDVYRESQGLLDISVLEPLIYPMSAAVLLLVQQVMSTVPVGDLKLVDLYGNKGTADPALIACAMHATEASQLTLFEEDWCVVSDDKAVRTKAHDFGVLAMRSKEFLTILRRDIDKRAAVPE